MVSGGLALAYDGRRGPDIVAGIGQTMIHRSSRRCLCGKEDQQGCNRASWWCRLCRSGIRSLRDVLRLSAGGSNRRRLTDGRARENTYGAEKFLRATRTQKMVERWPALLNRRRDDFGEATTTGYGATWFCLAKAPLVRDVIGGGSLRPHHVSTFLSARSRIGPIKLRGYKTLGLHFRCQGIATLQTIL